MSSFNERENRDGQVYKGSSNMGASSTYGDRVMSTLYNPFSIKNNTPKYPDGLASHSIGRKQQFASECFGYKMVICLFPGSTNWCFAYGTDVTDASNLDPVLIANHGDNRTFTIGQYTRTPTEDPNDPTINTTDDWSLTFKGNTYSAWRPVSYGLKIRCCNNDEMNDGWFEAIRVSRNHFLSQFGVVANILKADDSNTSLSEPSPADGRVYNPTVWRGNVLPLNNLADMLLHSNTWHRIPTYCTGELKDIGDYMFQLNQEKHENDFIKVKPLNGNVWAVSNLIKMARWNFTTGVDPRLIVPYANSIYETTKLQVMSPVQAVDDSTVGNNKQEEFFEVTKTFVADTMDMILVRIHGIKTATRIMLHSVANIELLCGELSELAQYMSVAYSHKDELQRFLDFRNSNYKLPLQTSDMYTG